MEPSALWPCIYTQESVFVDVMVALHDTQSYYLGVQLRARRGGRSIILDGGKFNYVFVVTLFRRRALRDVHEIAQSLLTQLHCLIVRFGARFLFRREIYRCLPAILSVASILVSDEYCD